MPIYLRTHTFTATELTFWYRENNTEWQYIFHVSLNIFRSGGPDADASGFIESVEEVNNNNASIQCNPTERKHHWAPPLSQTTMRRILGSTDKSNHSMFIIFWTVNSLEHSWALIWAHGHILLITTEQNKCRRELCFKHSHVHFRSDQITYRFVLNESSLILFGHLSTIKPEKSVQNRHNDLKAPHFSSCTCFK